MSAVVLRECERKDIPAIEEIEKECFSDAWTKEQLESEYSRFGFYGLVAQEGATVVGYALSGVLFERAELERIAVTACYRKQGVGGMLLDKLLEEAEKKGAEEMLLEVRESNLSAIKLYESRGFKLFHTRKGYYGGGENALEMKWEASLRN